MVGCSCEEVMNFRPANKYWKDLYKKLCIPRYFLSRENAGEEVPAELCRFLITYYCHATLPKTPKHLVVTVRQKKKKKDRYLNKRKDKLPKILSKFRQEPDRNLNVQEEYISRQTVVIEGSTGFSFQISSQCNSRTLYVFVLPTLSTCTIAT